MTILIKVPLIQELRMDNTIYRNHVIVISSGKKTIVFGHGFACDQNSQFAEDIKKTFTNEDPDIM